MIQVLTQVLGPILLIGLVILLFYKLANPGISLMGGTPIALVVSRWSHFFTSFSYSSDEFYTDLEARLKEHEMPNAVITRTQRKEAGILSASREYLRIKHGNLIFDVCAAPFGTDFFISWWLYETEGMLTSLLSKTKAGDFLKARANKRTFYQIDEEAMFRSCVHTCIMEAIDALSVQKGFRTLTDAERAFTMGGV